MTASTTAPAAPTVSTIFKSAEGIAIQQFLPILVTFLGKVQANSSISNLVAQGPALVVTLQAQLPNLQQAETAFIAGQLSTLLQNFASTLPQAPTS